MVRIGLIGVVAWWKNLLRNFYHVTNCQVLMRCDQDKKQLEKTAGSYPGFEITGDVQKVISNKEIQAKSLPPVQLHILIWLKGRLNKAELRQS